MTKGMFVKLGNEGTRVEVGCTHFIDDLIEVFRDKYFPAQVQKILLATTNTRADVANLKVLPAWQNIHHEFFSEFK